MGQALYRKHRPKSLDEVIGQEHITQTLAQAIKNGRISHAYLMTGPRGVGKTSVARILAHEINGLPYADDSSHVDIIEIDAASNRRIDEIRELRDKVYVAPASAKYKVYIIDEVHMLTKEAFNALLKTLEEPPAHVVFILATTDAHKLPETIISRTQRFSFRPVDRAAVVRHLEAIAKREKISVSAEALELLADHGEGSFRDSISLLDQAASYGEKLSVEDVQRLLGIPSTETIHDLLQVVSRGTDTALIMSLLSSLYTQGYQAASIAKQLSKLLRSQLAAGDDWVQSAEGLRLLEQLIEVPASRDPERFLEIILLQARGLAPARPVPVPIQPAAQKAPKPQLKPEADAQQVVKATAETPQTHTKASKKPSQQLSEATWPEILSVLKQRHNTLYGVIRMAQPSFANEGKIVLAFGFAFHEKRLKEANNRRLLADIIQELTGQAVTVECLLDKSISSNAFKPAKVETIPKPDLAAISNIFGGAELLES